MTRRRLNELALPTHCLQCCKPWKRCTCSELTTAAYRARQAALMTEATFQANVVRQAREWGWQVQYNTIAYRSPTGWPDLYLVRGERIVVAELKTMTGVVKEKQAKWLFRQWATGKIECFIWRPDYEHQIAEVLAP